MKKKIIMLVLAICAVFSFLVLIPEPIKAASSTEIAPTNAEFKNASKISSFGTGYYGYTSSGSYTVFKFTVEEHCTGVIYFDCYTTGSTDTVGWVYKDNSTLFKKKFNPVANTKGSNYCDDANNLNGTWSSNCCSTYALSAGTYFFCVRGYGSKSGSYYAYVGYHTDMIDNQYGGVWESNLIAKGLNMAGASCTGTCITGRYMYISKEQVQFMYQLYSALIVDSSVLKYYNKADKIEDRVLKVTSKALNTVGSKVALTAGKAIVAGTAANPVGLIIGGTLFITGFIISKIDTALVSGIKEMSNWIGRFKQYCDAKAVQDYASATTRYTASKGLLIKEEYTVGMGSNSRSYAYSLKAPTYEGYSGTRLYGQKMYNGTWTLYSKSEVYQEIGK